MIDKVYIINLKQRKDRKKKIIKELKKMNISNYTFFRAIKPNEQDIITWNPNFINPIPNWFKRTGNNETKYKIGSLGCMKSHLIIIQECIEKNYNHVLILEDDTIFNPIDTSLEQLINSKIEQLDYGLLYLSGNHRNAKLEKTNDEQLVKVNGTLTTGSYLISRKGMEFISQHLEGFEREIDVFYAQIVQQALPCYCFIPHLTGQDKGYSDIVQQDVNYNL